MCRACPVIAERGVWRRLSVFDESLGVGLNTSPVGAFQAVELHAAFTIACAQRPFAPHKNFRCGGGGSIRGPLRSPARSGHWAAGCPLHGDLGIAAGVGSEHRQPDGPSDAAHPAGGAHQVIRSSAGTRVNSQCFMAMGTSTPARASAKKAGTKRAPSQPKVATQAVFTRPMTMVLNR